MKIKGIRSYVSLSLLGAFDGLIFGAVVEVLRRVYTPIFLEYYLTRELEESPEGKVIPSMTRLMGGYFDIPLLCLVVFAAIMPPSILYLRKHYRSSPVLWQISGIIAAAIAVCIHDLFPPFGHDTWLLPLSWRLLFSMPIVSFINLVYGLVLEGWARLNSSQSYY